MSSARHRPATQVETDDIVRWFELLHWQQGKWVPEVVLVLNRGPTRFQEIRRAINARDTDRGYPSSALLSNSQLSRTLHAMHQKELLLRFEDRSHVPPTVIYELSPLFRDFLAAAIRPAADWIRHHHAEHMRS